MNDSQSGCVINGGIGGKGESNMGVKPLQLGSTSILVDMHMDEGLGVGAGRCESLGG